MRGELPVDADGLTRRLRALGMTQWKGSMWIHILPLLSLDLSQYGLRFCGVATDTGSARVSVSRSQPTPFRLAPSAECLRYGSSRHRWGYLVEPVPRSGPICRQVG